MASDAAVAPRKSTCQAGLRDVEGEDQEKWGGASIPHRGLPGWGTEKGGLIWGQSIRQIKPEPLLPQLAWELALLLHIWRTTEALGW